MRSARLTFALETGALALPPEGTVAVFRPRAGEDLSMLGPQRLRIITGFRPDFDDFTARGLTCTRHAEGLHAAAVVCLPRARAQARGLIAEAAAHVLPGGAVIVDGQKTDGVDSVLRDLRGRGIVIGAPVSKAHGKLAVFAAGPDLSDWAATETRVEGGFVTLPGVFSAEGPDRGSSLLAAALPAAMPPLVADMGAGWGWLSAQVLRRDGVRELHLIEAEADALDCARRNVTDPRARFHWADALRFAPAERFGAVVCNPPFHTGRAPDPALGVAFLRAAAAMLAPSGVLWLVANRHLPYAPVLETSFREVTEVGDDAAFRVFRAARPAAPAARQAVSPPQRARLRRRP